MSGFATFWNASDAIGRAVALLLLAMSVASWVTILWKLWVLKRARRDIERAVPAFWAAPLQAPTWRRPISGLRAWDGGCWRSAGSEWRSPSTTRRSIPICTRGWC